MRIFTLMLSFFILVNCSLNTESKFWTENNDKKKTYNLKLKEIMKKSANIFSMTLDEYMIYLDEYNKKNKYPDISK